MRAFYLNDNIASFEFFPLETLYKGVEAVLPAGGTTNLIANCDEMGFYHEKLEDSMRKAVRCCLEAVMK